MRSSHFPELKDSVLSIGSAMGDEGKDWLAFVEPFQRASRLKSVSMVPGLWEREGKKERTNKFS